MREARNAIREQEFAEWKSAMLASMKTEEEMIGLENTNE